MKLQLRTGILLVSLLALAGCRLDIVVPAGGTVVSQSGALDCSASETCAFEIVTEDFDDSFTAIPAAGFAFVRWESGYNSACGGETSPTCRVSLQQLPTRLRQSALASDSTVFLRPVFEVSEGSGGTGPVDIDGTISVLSDAFIDSDTNNPDNYDSASSPANNNDSVASAQDIANPSVVGGYVNTPRSGDRGATFTGGDLDDYFRVDAREGQVVTLIAAEFVTADLDLYLYNGDGQIVDRSIGTTDIEQITIPADGTWFLNPYAFDGASNYLLTIGDGQNVTGSDQPVVEGEVLISYAAETILTPSASQQRRRSVEHKFGLHPRGGGIARKRRLSSTAITAASLSASDDSRIQSMRAKLGENPELLAASEAWILAKALSREPGVTEASPNFRVRALATTNDTYREFLWHYDYISVPAAWDITVGAADVITAVVDTGIIASHPDFTGQLVDGYDFIASSAAARDGDGIDPDPTDEGVGSNPFRSGNFHGLHVSGTVAAAGNNNEGIAGVAYGSKVMPLRALDADGGGTVYDINQAIRFAAGLSNDSGTVPAQRADVINLSLGGGGFIQSEQNLYSQIAGLGVLIAAASGNESASSVGYPAAYDDVIAVGATDAQGVVTGYSNKGSALDLVAPGGRLSADANSDGKPDGVLSTYSVNGAAGYSFLEGTSMATPHVAGVMALMRSVNSDLDVNDFQVLLQTGSITDDLGATGRDNSYGWGIINARKAVVAALEAAGGSSNLPPLLGLSTTTINFGTGLSSVDVLVSNLGDGDLSVSGASVSEPWITVAASDTDASGLGTWTISVDRTGLEPGSYQDDVTFSSSAGNSDISVAVRVAGGGEGDIGTLYVLFIDSETQEVAAQAVTTAELNYEYSLGQLPAGSYEIWAGTDTDNDLFICDEGETCGAFPSIDSPASVNLFSSRDSLDFSSDYQIVLPSISSLAAPTTAKRGSTKYQKRRKE